MDETIFAQIEKAQGSCWKQWDVTGIYAHGRNLDVMDETLFPRIKKHMWVARSALHLDEQPVYAHVCGRTGWCTLSRPHEHIHTQYKEKGEKEHYSYFVAVGVCLAVKSRISLPDVKLLEMLKHINFLFLCTWFSPVAVRPPEVISPCMWISTWALHSVQHLIQSI